MVLGGCRVVGHLAPSGEGPARAARTECSQKVQVLSILGRWYQKTPRSMVVGTRALKYWGPGPSGSVDVESPWMQARTGYA